MSVQTFFSQLPAILFGGFGSERAFELTNSDAGEVRESEALGVDRRFSVAYWPTFREMASKLFGAGHPGLGGSRRAFRRRERQEIRQNLIYEFI